MMRSPRFWALESRPDGQSQGDRNTQRRHASRKSLLSEAKRKWEIPSCPVSLDSQKSFCRHRNLSTSSCPHITCELLRGASGPRALSSKFLIPLLTMGLSAFHHGHLGRSRGPRGCCGQPLRGPSRGTQRRLSGQPAALARRRARHLVEEADSPSLSTPGLRANRRCAVFAC